MSNRVTHRIASGTVACLILVGSVSVVSADVEDQYTEWSTAMNVDPNCEQGAPLNTGAGEQAAFISKDGLSLYLTSNRPGGFGGTDIYVSHRPSEDADWTAPVNLGPSINSAADEFAPSVTLDGHRLFFQSSRPGGAGGFDIYVSQRCNNIDDCTWEPAVSVSGDVNTAANEEHPAYFEDESTGAVTLYFTSLRPGGLGGDDIYASTLRPDGTFGPGQVVLELSTASFERQPALRRDGLEMFLASNRPGTFGGLDLWVSVRSNTSDPWSPPVNLGAGVNTTSVDARPALAFDGTELYFQSNRPDGCGALDLYVTTRTKQR